MKTRAITTIKIGEDEYKLPSSTLDRFGETETFWLAPYQLRYLEERGFIVRMGNNKLRILGNIRIRARGLNSSENPNGSILVVESSEELPNE